MPLPIASKVANPAATDLLDLTLPQLEDLVASWGQPRFRAAQVWQWLYGSLVNNPLEMANLPMTVRRRLADETGAVELVVETSLRAEDGLAEKVLLRADDGNRFETVLMRYARRNTVCVSSQIGCSLGCVFCATGQRGYVRNLRCGEITGQVLHFARKLRQENARVNNVVFMGMGEPMLNYDAVQCAIINLSDGNGLGLGTRRFTVSTVGIIPGIERLARQGCAIGLAISLHAPDDRLRDQLVPANRRYPLAGVMAAAELYVKRTGRRVTFEYALARGVNDSDDHAAKTADLLRGVLCHVNLIGLNPTPECPFEPATRARVLRFQRRLGRAGIPTTVRVRRGLDIVAGCGQLRGQVEG